MVQPSQRFWQNPIEDPRYSSPIRTLIQSTSSLIYETALFKTPDAVRRKYPCKSLLQLSDIPFSTFPVHCSHLSNSCYFYSYCKVPIIIQIPMKTAVTREKWILSGPCSSSFWLPRNLSNHMDRQALSGDAVLVKNREMTGRSQRLPWWLRGEGVKTTENKIRWLRWLLHSLKKTLIILSLRTLRKPFWRKLIQPWKRSSQNRTTIEYRQSSPKYPWYKVPKHIVKQWDFFNFFFSMYCIQYCFFCRPSDSTVSEDAEIEPRTVATSALAVRRSNQSVRSHPPTRLDLIHPLG